MQQPQQENASKTDATELQQRHETGQPHELGFLRLTWLTALRLADLGHHHKNVAPCPTRHESLNSVHLHKKRNPSMRRDEGLKDSMKQDKNVSGRAAPKRESLSTCTEACHGAEAAARAAEPNPAADGDTAQSSGKGHNSPGRN